VPHWYWDAYDTQLYEDWVELPKAFVQESGRRPRYQDEYEDADGNVRRLGGWCDDQRTEFKAGRLLPERVTAPEAVPGWSWQPNEDRWQFMHALLLEFVAEHRRLPKKSEPYKGGALSQWCHNRRAEFKNGDMSPERAAALDAVPGWSWELHEERWQFMCALLAEFVSEHRRQPRKRERYKGEALGMWSHMQRAVYKAGDLLPERVAALEALDGWSWELQEERWQ
jgi:phage pi2 protein 07